jgi:hypothetical protein
MVHVAYTHSRRTGAFETYDLGGQSRDRTGRLGGQAA